MVSWSKWVMARNVPDAIQTYNSASIDRTQANAMKPLPDIIVCSNLHRSRATARLLYGKYHLADATFDEAHLPAQSHMPLKLSAKTWFAIARVARLCGYSQNCDSPREFRRRVAAAALIKQSEGGNQGIAKNLKAAGFSAKSRLSSQHGLFTTFTRK
ncbi:MAG: hypothetical protein ACPG5U_00465 [Planktomarina sp.]